MPALLIIILMINVWIGLQIGAELFARWVEKKYLEHLKKQEEAKYDKSNRGRTSRPTRLPRYLKANFGIRRGRITWTKTN